MKFYGIDCQGYLKIQELSSLPAFSTGDDERKLIYVAGADDAFYVGGDTDNDWIRMVLDDDSTYSNLETKLGTVYHPLNGDVGESIAALSYSGDGVSTTDGTYTRITDRWVKLSSGSTLATSQKSGIRIEGGVNEGTGDVDDPTLFYIETSPTTSAGTPTNWQLLGGETSGTPYASYNDGTNTYTGDPLATLRYVDTVVGAGIGTVYTQEQVDDRFVRFEEGDSVDNYSWQNWLELTFATLGSNPSDGVGGNTPDRQIYRKDEAYDGFVRTSNWTENSPAGTARYAYVGTIATPRTGGDYQNSIVQRDATGNIFVNIMNGTATSAYYADLAEKYTCDENLEVGTVVEVSDGTDFEVVPCMFELSPVVVGVVSRNPAHLMNAGSVGLPIALTGKVEVKVIGAINKGDFIVPAGSGLARKGEPDELGFKMGICLKTDLQNEAKLVECIIK